MTFYGVAGSRNAIHRPLPRTLQLQELYSAQCSHQPFSKLSKTALANPLLLSEASSFSGSAGTDEVPFPYLSAVKQKADERIFRPDFLE
jgi:hypothetical protein